VKIIDDGHDRLEGEVADGPQGVLDVAADLSRAALTLL
jgi:hypothetical protein